MERIFSETYDGTFVDGFLAENPRTIGQHMKVIFKENTGVCFFSASLPEDPHFLVQANAFIVSAPKQVLEDLGFSGNFMVKLGEEKTNQLALSIFHKRHDITGMIMLDAVTPVLNGEVPPIYYTEPHELLTFCYTAFNTERVAIYFSA